jgi:D-aminopeptidase
MDEVSQCLAHHNICFDSDAIDAIFAPLNQCHLPGAAVGIAIDGVPVYRKGFGLASMELPVVLSPSIRLRLGSTSKHFTCFAYMLLCDEGIAEIDHPIGRYLPELHPVARNVTMRQLMGNTSGLRDVYDIFGQFNEPYAHYGGPAQSVACSELLRLYCDIDDANAEPGTTWIYNNGGWLLLSLAIERITGQTLEQVMSERIFNAIGMFDSLLQRSDTDFVANRGSQHVTNPKGGFEKMYWGLENFLGAGALLSTVDDMLTWMAHMDAPSVGSKQTWELMRTPQRLSNGCYTHYGLGLIIDRYRGIETLHHGGNAFGGNVQMLKVPSAALDVIVMVNRQDVWAFTLVGKILDTCLPALEPIRSPSVRPLVTGTFRSPASGRIIQLYDKNGQQIAAMGAAELPLEADDSGVFRCTYLETKETIKLIGDRAHPDGILLGEFGNVDELTRAREASASDGAEIIGRYRAEATGIEATIAGAKTDLRLVTAGAFGSVTYQLECIAENIWRAKTASATRIGFLGGVLAFDGTKESFLFSSYLTWSLTFRRDP